MALLMASRRPVTRPAPPEPRTAREALRAQVARLEQELTELGCSAWPRTDLRGGVGARGGARLLSLGQLEGLRDALAAEVSRLRRALDERGAREEESRRLVEEMLLDPEAHQWVRVSAADIGEPSCREWEAIPALGP